MWTYAHRTTRLGANPREGSRKRPQRKAFRHDANRQSRRLGKSRIEKLTEKRTPIALAGTFSVLPLSPVEGSPGQFVVSQHSFHRPTFGFYLALPPKYNILSV